MTLLSQSGGLVNPNFQQGLDPSQIPVKITSEPIGKDPIDPMQYGQFIEYLCDLVPGMWSEKLCDGSFEGLSPYKFEFVKETDFRQHPWYAYGQVDRMTVDRDSSTKVAGESSEAIELQGPGAITGGVAQVQATVMAAAQSFRQKLEPTDSEGNPTGEVLFNVEPKSFLVVGTLQQFQTPAGVNESKLQSFEVFRRNTHQPEIITYDELFERARFIVGDEE